LALVLTALGGTNAQAGPIPLPSTLPPLEVPGNFAVVNNLKFSDFTYTATPLGSPPLDSGITVSEFHSVPGNPGITFSAGFAAAAQHTVDYKIGYRVDTFDGTQISAAYLSLGGFVTFGGSGSVSISETVTDLGGTIISKVPFQVSGPGQTSDTSPLLPPATTILVTEDILVTGGSNGAAFSFANQGFATTVPEPCSMALLGIGVSALFTLRRFLKRTSVA
jgi:hypothetical protein